MAAIEKGSVEVRLTTTRNVIYGTLARPTHSRTLDLLNSKDKFIALTEAIVFDGEQGTGQDKKFVAVNVENIVSVEEM
ncbi:MAG: hypothetical protein RQ824_03045 [bacterium]|nr:hypothetical protein [bacterium]